MRPTEIPDRIAIRILHLHCCFDHVLGIWQWLRTCLLVRSHLCSSLLMICLSGKGPVKHRKNHLQLAETHLFHKCFHFHQGCHWIKIVSVCLLVFSVRLLATKLEIQMIVVWWERVFQKESFRYHCPVSCDQSRIKTLKNPKAMCFSFHLKKLYYRQESCWLCSSKNKIHCRLWGSIPRVKLKSEACQWVCSEISQRHV